MADYSLSRKAADDLDGIHEYTILNFGLDQAREYLTGLHERFQSLAENPSLGRKADWLVPGIRRFEHQSHIVFFVKAEGGIQIVRVLHRNMDVESQL